MALLTDADPQISLIEATIRFANGEPPNVAFGPIVAESRRQIRAHGMTKVLDAVAGQHKSPIDTDPRNQLREQLTIIGLLNGFVGTDKSVKGALRGVQATQVDWLGKEGPRGLVLRGLEATDGHFEEFVLPIRTDFNSCVKDGLSLILSNYRGAYERVFICPHGATTMLQLEPSQIVKSLELFIAHHELHFFADLRFIKGTPMKYCSVRHQRADYMRKYRQRKQQ